ncbi:MAG: macro domain-containing protein [Candidatus Omnitrophota bacterium]
MKIHDTEIIVIKGDITKTKVEAIVNAANNQFLMGGGVAGVIKRKGGKIIEDQAVKQGPVKVGQAVLTTAGSLGVKYVIHATTMAMDFRTDEDIIRAATYNALQCARKHKISSIAFCALGCGVGGFSLESTSKIMAQEVFRYLKEEKSPTIKKVVFVLSSQDAYVIFNKNVYLYLDYIDKKISQGPFITVDGIIEYEGGVVMVQRSNPPLGWALPGGFVDYGESVETAVVREVKEETNLDFIDFKQWKVCSDPARDPRFHTISVIFIGKGKGTLKADSDVKDAKGYKLDSLPSKISFDHRKIIEEYSAFSNL